MLCLRYTSVGLSGHALRLQYTCVLQARVALAVHTRYAMYTLYLLALVVHIHCTSCLHYMLVLHAHCACVVHTLCLCYACVALVVHMRCTSIVKFLFVEYEC